MILLAAVANVPWAFALLRSDHASTRPSDIHEERAPAPEQWPSSTPHRAAWPAPDYWWEISSFGYLNLDVRSLKTPTHKKKSEFVMDLQLVGWPCPVLEKKQLWWDFDDPALNGPEAFPPVSLQMQGLLLNPLILGTVAWVVLLVLWFVVVLLVRKRASAQWLTQVVWLPDWSRRCLHGVGSAIAPAHPESLPKHGGRIIRRDETLRAIKLLALFVLLAAIVNVPWAVTFMRPGAKALRLVGPIREPSPIPAHWPSSTPHQTAWPAPDYWRESKAFGCQAFDVRSVSSSKRKGQNHFSMRVQQAGWPYQVVEEKYLFWDFNDPALQGPETAPAASIQTKGFLLNSALLGTLAWVLVVMPWILVKIAIRYLRRRSNRCTACGYPIGVSTVCTECGAPFGTAVSV